ncbi:M48 family metallopeptidase [Verrucomicrobiaceae bacterium N1E253]|uniref:M48 family metallopeptidase n=1 Tax=Oceaniferula marina TaxID=2748318 RepID=A0A851GK55_9BACT|nr:M48 family metallopeptidase [Oceaniferula marina]NWK54554.1 M48 family metallopeptidase [Oceaniferula marina]
MNFFEAQDDARRRTRWLVVYYILAVVGIILSVYAIVAGVMAYLGMSDGLWMPEVLLMTAVGAGGMMGIGSLFKTMQLSGGGAVVARDMGARQVDPHTTDPEEKRYVNVVEEMAIASGVPVPEIWIMDDELGINAFAAGSEPGNAVVAVTRGCIQRLSRDELQGVVAHEFSHILNGDMRLNMRLMGLLFGILMISMIGRMLFHAMRFMPMRSSRNDRNGGAAGIAIAIFLAGIGLMIVGSVGVFFGRMIQAAISRQREYLADASAVQFTRNPDGIANALKKIGGMQYGSKMESPKAAEASHLFFADGGMFSYGLATHPPLDVRIRAIQKSWDGEFLETDIPDMDGVSSGRPLAAASSGLSQGTVFLSSSPSVDGGQIREMGGDSRVDVKLGQSMLQSIKPEWLDACHDRSQAQALMFGMLLSDEPDMRKRQTESIRQQLGDAAVENSKRWRVETHAESSQMKIALIDLAIPSLRRLSPPEYDRFIQMTQWLISSDGQVELFEMMIQKVLQRHLDVHFKRQAFPGIRYRKMEDLLEDANVLWTTLAAMGGENQMADAYQTALADSAWSLQMLPPQDCGLQRIDQSLDRFNLATPLVKQQLLQVCGRIVMHDDVVEAGEAELIRVVADSIGCAVPPFVRMHQ